MTLSAGALNSAVQIIGDRIVPTIVGETYVRGQIGTGFLVGVPSRVPGFRYIYVVTAHHVLDGQHSIEVAAPDPLTNGAYFAPRPVAEWWQPVKELDLVVSPFWTPDAVVGLAIEENFLPPHLAVPLGGPIFYIGVFEPIGRVIARSGTCAARDQEGLKHDGPYDYAAHLVDCRSYGGFSGSPCFSVATFAKLDPFRPDPTLGLSAETFGQIQMISLFCGMFTQHFETGGSDASAITAVSRFGIGVMLPSIEVWRIFLSDEMKKQREAADAALEANDASSPALRKVSAIRQKTAGHAEEYERFEDLARRLANTPKPKDALGE